MTAPAAFDAVVGPAVLGALVTCFEHNTALAQAFTDALRARSRGSICADIDHAPLLDGHELFRT